MEDRLRITYVAVFALALSATAASANQAEFCRGYHDGYKLILGNNVGLPGCPGAPGTPGNSTPYQEGLKRGIEAAGGNLNC